MPLATSRALPDSTLLSLIRQFRRLARLFVAVITVLSCASLVSAQGRIAGILAFNEDAYISYNSGLKQWSVGARGMQLQIGFSKSGALTLLKFWNPDSNRDWLISADSDVGVTIRGEALTLQEAGTRTRFLQATAVTTDTGVALNLLFEHRELHTVITRVFAAYPGTPTIETWTRIDQPPGSPAIQVSDMAGWQLNMPAARVRWVNGMGIGSNLPEPAYAIQSRDLEDGGRIDIGSDRRSSEQQEPFIFVDDGTTVFYGGVIWSGQWHIGVERSGGMLSTRAEIPLASPLAAADHPVEFPHMFFGATDASTDAESAALRQFVVRGMRKGRPFRPLVTYNTWFPYGTRINQSIVIDEMMRAANLGIELFVLDAGWYLGTGADGYFDYSSGLGSWTVDTDRFPGKLEDLAEIAHGLGIKFGIWVEPERVALSTVGKPGLAREEWLAMQDGTYGDLVSAQLCLASNAARDWVFGKIVELIDRVHPDYLKWDNNFWLNCNRPGHDHADSDGNYAHVVALYGMLDELRRRYPDMLIENVSGGGNRLDFGMLAYSDVGWMDDRTTPSSHVRHNLEGLILAFPPAYLLSFVMESESEPLAGGVDFSHIARSRMPGVLGVSYKSAAVDPGLGDALSEEIAQYKNVRDTIAQAHAVLLTDQGPLADGWEVVEEIAEDRASAVIFAFKTTTDQGRIVVRPKSLLPGSMYQVGSMDSGGLSVDSGENLMNFGIEIAHSNGSRAHVLYLAPAPPVTEQKR